MPIITHAALLLFGAEVRDSETIDLQVELIGQRVAEENPLLFDWMASIAKALEKDRSDLSPSMLFAYGALLTYQLLEKQRVLDE